MKKPSKIAVVTAKKGILMLPSIRAITLFGTIFCKKESDVQLINKTDKIDSDLKSHETIHVRQAQNVKDSWLLYYIVYIWQWICNLPLMFVMLYAPYLFIEFELEAYSNENNWEYCNKECDGWKKYKKLTLKQKFGFAKEYRKRRYGFSKFVRENIDPIL